MELPTKTRRPPGRGNRTWLLLAAFAVFTLAGAADAHAHHREDEIVFDQDGNLQPDALDVITGTGVAAAAAGVMFIPHHLMTQIWTTQTMTIAGFGSVPAGTQLSKAQFAALSNAQLANVVEGMPTTVGTQEPTQRQKNVDKTLDKARRAGRVLPAVKAGGTLVLAVGGGGFPVFERAVKMEIPGQGFIFNLWSGENEWSTTVPSGVTSWIHCTSPTCVSTGGFTVVAGMWYLQWTTHTGLYADPATNSDSFRQPFTDGAIAEPGTRNATTNPACTSPDAGPCYWKTRTEAEHEALTGGRRLSERDYNDYSGAKTDLGSYNQPTYNDTDVTNITNEFGSPGTQTTAQKDAEDAVRNEIEPGSVPGSGTDPDTGTSPVPIVPPPTTIPSPGGIDFTPITDLDFGCKFPYGLICWAEDVTGWFNVAADAPTFTFDIPSVTVAGTTYGGGDDDWIVDLEVMDTFMSMLRALIALVLWVGGVYWLAASLLGFRAGGDPGQAADEALHV